MLSPPVNVIKKGLAANSDPDHKPPRVGEIKDSFANIDKAKELLK